MAVKSSKKKSSKNNKKKNTIKKNVNQVNTKKNKKNTTKRNVNNNVGNGKKKNVNNKNNFKNNIKNIENKNLKEQEIKNIEIKEELLENSIYDENIIESIIDKEEIDKKDVLEKELNNQEEILDDNKISVIEQEENNKDTVILDENEYEELVKVIDKSMFRNKYYFLIGALLIGLLLFYICIPKISLFGEEEVVITYYNEYVESGYSANILWKDITNKVKINSNLVNNKIGKYKIEYLVDYGFINVKKERYVNIIDDKEPVINVATDVIKICPNQELPKLEYSVIDEYDGDVTDNTLEEIDGNKIKLKASDSSNNMVVKEINIDRSDDVKPVINLKGYSTVYLVLGERYNESGYSASDNCDGDISSKVVVTGSIGTSVGNYKLIYTVSDSSGNKSEVYREVIVINKYISNNGSASNGSIYLTFDDGPNEGTTNIILDILRDEGVKATFFVTSKGPDYLIKRMYDEGHTVALHTAGHDYAYIYSSIDNYFNDLNTISNRVERITGEKSMIIRFPGGSSNSVSRSYKVGIMTSLSKLVLSKGYRYYDWNIDSMDASSAYSSQVVYNNVVNHLSKNRVNMILMHDTKAITRDAIRNIIRYGKSNGYNFEKIDMSTYMIKHGIVN